MRLPALLVLATLLGSGVNLCVSVFFVDIAFEHAGFRERRSSRFGRQRPNVGLLSAIMVVHRRGRLRVRRLERSGRVRRLPLLGTALRTTFASSAPILPPPSAAATTPPAARVALLCGLLLRGGRSNNRLLFDDGFGNEFRVP